MTVENKTSPGVVHGYLITMLGPEGYVSAISWSDPGERPIRGKNIQSLVYEHPYTRPGESAAKAIDNWAAHMKRERKAECIVFVDLLSVPHADKTVVKDNVLAVYGVPRPEIKTNPNKIRFDAALQALASMGYGENLIVCQDGSYAATPYDAVRKYMCPGPCSPDCYLHKGIRLPDNRYRYMCDEEVVAMMPDEVLKAIGARYKAKGE